MNTKDIYIDPPVELEIERLRAASAKLREVPGAGEDQFSDRLQDTLAVARAIADDCMQVCCYSALF